MLVDRFGRLLRGDAVGLTGNGAARFLCLTERVFDRAGRVADYAG